MVLMRGHTIECVRDHTTPTPPPHHVMMTCDRIAFVRICLSHSLDVSSSSKIVFSKQDLLKLICVTDEQRHHAWNDTRARSPAIDVARRASDSIRFIRSA